MIGKLRALAVATAIAGAIAFAGRAEAAGVGDRAPDFGGSWLNFEPATTTLADLEGRVVLLEFWRTW